MSYKVKLNIFEGPFDLLVYLIESAKMSIYDIAISEITDQYLRYMSEMKALNIELSAEFMVLAATLLQIKSKMLLPKAGTLQGDEQEEDPRNELVEMILEYKKYKSAAAFFQEKEELNRKSFTKPQEDLSVYIKKEEENLLLDQDQFMKAFQNFLERKKQIDDVQRRYQQVRRERMSMETKSQYLISALKKKKKLSFDELLPDVSDLYDVVLTFASLLELMGQSVIQAHQDTSYGEIKIVYCGEENM